MSVSKPPAVKSAGPIGRRTLSKPLTALVVLILLVVITLSLCAHRENKVERLTDRVLQAIQHNDMKPVENDFNAIRREQLTHASVGKNSDLLAPLGQLHNVSETTPKDAAPRRHTFLAHFDKGDMNVVLVLDEDGKITGFRFTPANPKS